MWQNICFYTIFAFLIRYTEELQGKQCKRQHIDSLQVFTEVESSISSDILVNKLDVPVTYYQPFFTRPQNTQLGRISKRWKHMEHIQISRGKKDCIWLFTQCLFWIHAQNKRKKSKLCFEEMRGGGIKEKMAKKLEWQREEDIKIQRDTKAVCRKAQWAAKANKQQHTVWDALSELCCCWEPAGVRDPRYTLNLLDTSISKVFTDLWGVLHYTTGLNA